MPTPEPNQKPQQVPADSRPLHDANISADAPPGRTQAISVGDTVAYSRRFLRSISAFTGEMPRARGRVVAISQLGKDVTLAAVEWNTPELPGRVNVKNLVRADRIHLEAD
jgi:hypothetical protein